MFYVLVAIAVVSSLYFVVPGVIVAEETPRTFLTHTGLAIQTTGDVIDPIGYDGEALDFDPDKFMKEFDYGDVTVLDDGTILREFYITSRDDQIMEVSPGVFYNVWTFNDSVPGPTIRATEGDLIRIHFTNEGSKSHSLHFHGIHKAEMDGVFENVGTGGTFTYEFYADPVGLHLYHCHVHPVEEHIAHGLYGAYIVDPKEAREPAEEFVFVLNGLDTDFDGENNFYAANTI
ncbi:MAG: multicopper oxidase domain-containing protein, partial [Candidatus Nitrosopelagicus sp.]|nr:multicopper oxidase domain-containing protein [Candidatus Nitrosopelagicus sp.]